MKKDIRGKDIAARTESTTTYELTGGEKMTVFHSEDVRFEDEDGILKDYDPDLEEIEDKDIVPAEDAAGYVYENKEGDSRQYLPQTLSEESPVIMEKGEKRISMSLAEDTLFSCGITERAARENRRLLD